MTSLSLWSHVTVFAFEGGILLVFPAQLLMRNAINCQRAGTLGCSQAFSMDALSPPASPLLGVGNLRWPVFSRPTHRDESLLLASPRMVPWEAEVSALSASPESGWPSARAHRLSAQARTYQGVCRREGSWVSLAALWPTEGSAGKVHAVLCEQGCPWSPGSG